MRKAAIAITTIIFALTLNAQESGKWSKGHLKNPAFTKNKKYAKGGDAKTIFIADGKLKSGEEVIIPDAWNIHKGAYLESYKDKKGVVCVPGVNNLAKYTKVWQPVNLKKNKYKLIKLIFRYRHEKLRVRDSRDEENKYREGRLIISFQDKDGKMIWPLGQQGAYSQPIPSFDKWNLNTYSINIPKGAVSFQVIFCANDPQNKLFVDKIKLQLLKGASSELHPEKKKMETKQ